MKRFLLLFLTVALVFVSLTGFSADAYHARHEGWNETLLAEIDHVFPPEAPDGIALKANTEAIVNSAAQRLNYLKAAQLPEERPQNELKGEVIFHAENLSFNAYIYGETPDAVITSREELDCYYATLCEELTPYAPHRSRYEKLTEIDYTQKSVLLMCFLTQSEYGSIDISGVYVENDNVIVMLEDDSHWWDDDTPAFPAYSFIAYAVDKADMPKYDGVLDVFYGIEYPKCDLYYSVKRLSFNEYRAEFVYGEEAANTKYDKDAKRALEATVYDYYSVETDAYKEFQSKYGPDNMVYALPYNIECVDRRDQTLPVKLFDLTETVEYEFLSAGGHDSVYGFDYGYHESGGAGVRGSGIITSLDEANAWFFYKSPTLQYGEVEFYEMLTSVDYTTKAVLVLDPNISVSAGTFCSLDRIVIQDGKVIAIFKREQPRTDIQSKRSEFGYRLIVDKADLPEDLSGLEFYSYFEYTDGYVDPENDQVAISGKTFNFVEWPEDWLIHGMGPGWFKIMN